jgi:hypothetical protein
MKYLPHNVYLYTPAWLCQHFQTSPSEVERILAAAGVEPALVINDLRHYDGAAFAALREAARDE